MLHADRVTRISLVEVWITTCSCGRLLRASTTQARTVIQRIVKGRITFMPLVDTLGLGQTGYDFSAPTRFDQLFTGIATPRPKDLDLNDRAGLEGIGPEDTLEADYGRLLAQAVANNGKVKRARRGALLTVGIQGVVKVVPGALRETTT